MFSLSKDKRISTNIVVELRSASVSVTCFTQEDYPRIIYTNTIYITTPKEKDGHLNEGVKKTVEKLCHELIRELAKNKDLKYPSKINVVAYSPLHGSVVENIVKSSEDSVLFSEKDLNTLLKPASDYQNNRIDVLENDISSFSLNGYRVKNPVGKKYRKIAISKYFSSIDKKLKKEITETIHKSFTGMDIEINTFPYIFSKAIHKINPILSSLVVVISGESTDLINIKDGDLVGISNINIGSHHALKKIMPDSNISSDTFSLIVSKNTVGSKMIKQRKIIKESYEEWSNLLISNIEDDFKNMGNILLISEDETCLDFVINQISEYKLKKISKSELMKKIKLEQNDRIPHILSVFSVFALNDK